MPRNPSGDYSLPAGNPVTSGTPISSAVNNSTMSDIATALTDSLSRTGKGGMLVPFQLADGAQGAPSLAFASEPTTGVYHPGTGAYSVVVQGVVAFSMNSANATPPSVAQFGLPLTQVIAGTGYTVLNRKSDYLLAGGAQILGTWEFDIVPSVVGSGSMVYNDDPLAQSGAIIVTSVAPGIGDGLPGDIWFLV